MSVRKAETIIRNAESKDFDRILKFTRKHNLSMATKGKTIIAEIDKEIKAMITVRTVLQVTPFITENSVVGKKLFDVVEEKLKKIGEDVVLQFFTDPKNEKLFNKVGFYKVFEDKISMEKIITKD